MTTDVCVDGRVTSANFVKSKLAKFHEITKIIICTEQIVDNVISSNYPNRIYFMSIIMLRLR